LTPCQPEVSPKSSCIVAVEEATNSEGEEDSNQRETFENWKNAKS